MRRAALRPVKARPCARVARRRARLRLGLPPDVRRASPRPPRFHGAAPSVLREIVSTGFDTRVANLTGMLGAGTYFASRASYSNDYSSRAAHNAEDMQRPPVPQYAGRKRGKGSAAAYAAAMAMAARAPPAHVGSERQMLLVRVVEGLAGTGVQGQRRPLRGCHSACAPDAAVGGVPQRLICIFDHTQAYPE